MSNKTDKQQISIRLDAQTLARIEALRTTLSPPVDLTVSQVVRALVLRAGGEVEAPSLTAKAQAAADDSSGGDEFKRGQDDMRERISRRLYGIYRSACEADSNMCWPGDLKLIAEGLDRGFVE